MIQRTDKKYLKAKYYRFKYALDTQEKILQEQILEIAKAQLLIDQTRVMIEATKPM
jgi:hypothetical protein